VARGPFELRSAARAGLPLVSLVAVLVLLAGCGSKISEANYYRIQNGMVEDAVEDLLGPAHRESTEYAPDVEPAATAPTTGPHESRPPGRKIKTWSRGSLTISVVFEQGKVVGRRVTGGQEGAR
jgi:hypothetical protein